MFDVVGVGANSVDYVYRLPDFPAPEGPTSKLRIMQHAISPGGQTATTLCTCAAMGLEPTYIGAAGNDDNGELIRDELTNRSVDVSHLAIRDTDNAFAVILRTTNRASGSSCGTESELDLEPEEIDPDAISSARLVHVDDVDESAAILAVSLARASGIPATSDIERVGARTGELPSFVTILIFAEHVLETLTGEQDFEQGLRAVQEPHHDMVCVTLGARGARTGRGRSTLPRRRHSGGCRRQQRGGRCLPRRVHRGVAARQRPAGHPAIRQPRGGTQLHSAARHRRHSGARRDTGIELPQTPRRSRR